MTQITLSEIAELVGGKLSGDPDLLITGASTIRNATKGDITLADKPELENKLAECNASAVVVDSTFSPKIPAIVVENVHEAFTKIVSHFRPARKFATSTISPHAIIDESAKIADGVTIHPRVTIGADVEISSGVTIHTGVVIMDGCRIGESTQIFPNTVLYENTVVGDRCLIHAGVILGAYGFGYASGTGSHKLSAQLGYVQIGNDVEVGAGTTIDRGTYDATTIGEGTKIDNQVMIAHNCSIGKSNLICSQVGIAGSSSTGDFVVMAGQAGMADHLHVSDEVIIGAKTGIMHDITEKGVYFGIPCYPVRDMMKQLSAVRKLPDTVKEIKRIKGEVAKLTQDLKAAEEATETGAEANSKSSAA